MQLIHHWRSDAVIFSRKWQFRCSPDQVAGLLEALGAETAAVGKLGFRFELHGLVLDLADPIPLSSWLGEDSLWQRGLLSRVLCELGCLLLREGDDFQALPLWQLLPIFIFLILYLLPTILTVQTDNCKSITVVFGWTLTQMQTDASWLVLKSTNCISLTLLLHIVLLPHVLFAQKAGPEALVTCGAFVWLYVADHVTVQAAVGGERGIANVTFKWLHSC